MTHRAVDRHNIMGGRGFRVDQLKFRTFVFQFLALVSTPPAAGHSTYHLHWLFARLPQSHEGKQLVGEIRRQGVERKEASLKHVVSTGAGSALLSLQELANIFWVEIKVQYVFVCTNIEQSLCAPTRYLSVPEGCASWWPYLGFSSETTNHPNDTFLKMGK